ncbi:hypothetical protein [Thermomonas sp. HDW16]|uniref:hypothetical protein n=1 Tax=Thermomonas sp. HDW16 TaxID=2714945 RepID=UPI00140C12BE|nr:hypothetical protein [Thermomonas sp. HDW16]QIL20529.1 hypothetical protein G7079_07165 [Thermomonas sp. HDW16]
MLSAHQRRASSNSPTSAATTLHAAREFPLDQSGVPRLPHPKLQFGPWWIASETALSSLAYAMARAVGKTIEIVEAPQLFEPQSWHHHWTDDNAVVLSLARQGDGYLLRFPDLADFLLQPHASRISIIQRNASTDDATLEHLLIDQVLPRYLAHEGMLSLHASTLVIGGKCVLILGKSGAGKSTLSGFLAVRGHTLRSDDCTLVELDGSLALATPTYPSLRLLPDSIEALYPAGTDMRPMAHYSSKQRVVPQAVDTGLPTLPIDGFLVLDNAAPANAAPLTPMTAAESCLALIRHSFQLDPGDKRRMATHLHMCSEVARMLPACRLAYPRRYDAMTDVASLIEAHVSAMPIATAAHAPTPASGS